MNRVEARALIGRFNLIWSSSSPPEAAQAYWLDTIAGVEARVGERAVDILEKSTRRWPSIAEWQEAARLATREEAASGRPVAQAGARTPEQVEHCPLCDPPGWVVTDDDTRHGTVHPCPNGCPPGHPPRRNRGRMPDPAVVRAGVAALFGRPVGEPVPALSADGADGAWSDLEPF